MEFDITDLDTIDVAQAAVDSNLDSAALGFDLSWLDNIVITADGGIETDPLYCDGEREMILDTILDTAVFVEYNIEQIAFVVGVIPISSARELEAFAILASETMGRNLYELRHAKKNSYTEAFALSRLAEVRDRITAIADALKFERFSGI
jgi:hypothetical protein